MFIKENLKLDLTGAGDLFAGGFIHGYINGKTIRECLEKEPNIKSNPDYWSKINLTYLFFKNSLFLF